MKLFKRRQIDERNESGKDKLAASIAKYIIKAQSAFASRMNKLTKNMSGTSMKWSLAIFLLIGSSLSICCITAAFLKKDHGYSIRIGRIHVPQYHTKSSDESVQQNLLVTKKAHEKILAFKHYMDSLKQSTDGRIIYDSIILKRPGLVDSVNQLEELYQKQSKDKK